MYIYFCIVLYIAKIHYLKLHYYIFLRNIKYKNLLNYIVNLEHNFIDFLGFLYNYFVFFKIHGFRIILIIILVYSICFKGGDLYFVVLILPYYSLYYFILLIQNFILTKFKYDFDILIMESYYKNIYYVMELNEFKKREYIKFLILNCSKYKFEDSIYLLINEKSGIANVLIIETYKYSLNKSPNDFFSRILKVNPELIKKSGDTKKY